MDMATGLPFVTAAAKAGHALLVVGALTRLRRDHMRYCFAMAGNRHGLATLGPSVRVPPSGPWLQSLVWCASQVPTSQYNQI